jgi:aminoglycoside phosphotransferase (APT) family kinase protein
VWQAAVDEARRSAGGDAVDQVRGGAMVHGDLHVDNVLVGERGPVLLDLELSGWGPRAYDAAPTVTFTRWFDRPASDLAAFDAAYGAPLTTGASEQGLDEVWRLWSACWAVANRHRSEAAADEAEVRIATVATGEAPRPWRLR